MGQSLHPAPRIHARRHSAAPDSCYLIFHLNPWHIMKGDFSQWRFDPGENFTGVLQQQGKVLLDSDWNEHTRIHTHWQDQAGQDAIGPDVAAVPTGAPDGFKILAARVVTGSGDPFVQVDLHPGRVWADGILVYLPAADP